MQKRIISTSSSSVTTFPASTDAGDDFEYPSVKLDVTGQPSDYHIYDQDPGGLTGEETLHISKVDIAAAARQILCAVGEDPTREGLADTPNRYAEALQFFTQGYSKNIRQVSNGAIFSVDSRELVIVRDIDIFSMCEHHMVPFVGKAGYVPNGHVLGLSKLPRIAEVYARRLQIQERLTKQVGEAINEVLNPLGVAVVLECTHMCMVMRGVQKTGTVTLTQSMTGLLKDDPSEQQRFYALLAQGKQS